MKDLKGGWQSPSQQVDSLAIGPGHWQIAVAAAAAVVGQRKWMWSSRFPEGRLLELETANVAAGHESDLKFIDLCPPADSNEKCGVDLSANRKFYSEGM